MKKNLVHIIILFLTINILLINHSMASISDVITDGDSFIAAVDDSITIDNTKLKNTSQFVYRLLFVIGMSAAVIVGAVLGVQFMMGSVEEKSKIKESLIPFLIGCIVIFGAFTIWSIVVNIASKLS